MEEIKNFHIDEDTKKTEESKDDFVATPSIEHQFDSDNEASLEPKDGNKLSSINFIKSNSELLQTKNIRGAVFYKNNIRNTDLEIKEESNENSIDSNF